MKAKQSLADVLVGLGSVVMVWGSFASIHQGWLDVGLAVATAIAGGGMIVAGLSVWMSGEAKVTK